MLLNKTVKLTKTYSGDSAFKSHFSMRTLMEIKKGLSDHVNWFTTNEELNGAR